VDGLTPGAAWFGWTHAPTEAAISDKVLDQRKGWFSSANCNESDGCNEVWIYVVDNGAKVDLALNPPATASLCQPYFRGSIGTDVGPTFDAFWSTAGFLDLEYWVGDQPHRTRLTFDAGVIGYRLLASSRYGSLWAYPDVCTPSQVASDFLPWAEGDGLERILRP
jgi:hypothetical protein